MDYTSVIAIGLGAASAATCALLYRWAKNAPEGYEDSEGFHLGEAPVPVPALQDIPRVSDTPHAIDWTKPLEFSDGTPVVLSPQDVWNKTNPDEDGDYWVRLPDGHDTCCDASGKNWHFGQLRNRAEPAAACAVPPAGWDCTRTPGHDGPCAAIPANSNLPTLTSDQRAVLLEMSDEIGWTAATLQDRTGLPHKRVVFARRQLADMGLVVLTSLRGDCGEDNKLAGRGYILTAEGARVQSDLEQLEMARTWVAA